MNQDEGDLIIFTILLFVVLLVACVGGVLMNRPKKIAVSANYIRKNQSPWALKLLDFLITKDVQRLTLNTFASRYQHNRK
mgnify:CR=1 FL=1